MQSQEEDTSSNRSYFYTLVNDYSVSLAEEQRRLNQERGHATALAARRDTFLEQHEWPASDDESIIFTDEGEHLRKWCSQFSWSHCNVCSGLLRNKLLPSFRKNRASGRTSPCNCADNKYVIPNASDVPELLKNLTREDVQVLRPLNLHCGEYSRKRNGYRERTGPFRVSWSTLSVYDKIQNVQDVEKRQRLRETFEFLMTHSASSYGKFVSMWRPGQTAQLYEIYTSPAYEGVECAPWPSLYHCTQMCESVIKGQSNRASAKESYMRKLLSPVMDYALDFNLLSYQYDRWLFKTITGAVNTGKASGCSPNASLKKKSFSSAFWRWQHLYLLDAVKQHGFPSLFVTISPYEWSFPWPDFIQELRRDCALGATDIPTLETIHIAHILEQVARGYLTGGNSNRWRDHVFSDIEESQRRNVTTYFYRLEFQDRGTVHLHMLIWLKDLTRIRADLLNASINWGNREDAFAIADTQKSDRTCLSVNASPNSFVERADGSSTLEFHYSDRDAERNIRAHVTTLLGALRCRTDVQVADGKGMLLKYVTSYVTKLKNGANDEYLYSCDATGYQAANCFLRSLRPLAPEMVLQLSGIKLAWTDKPCKQFVVPHPGQESCNKLYKMYLERPSSEENLCLLQWLRSHTHARDKVKSVQQDKYLVGVKLSSIFNSIYFFQHLLVHLPHRSADTLRHREEHSMPECVRHFAQALCLCPDRWTTATDIRSQLDKEGHREDFISTAVSFVLSLQNVLQLWQKRVIDGNLVTMQERSVETIFPLSPRQMLVYADIIDCMQKRQSQTRHLNRESQSEDWRRYRVILGKPGTGKSQVLIRVLQYAVDNELNALVATPLALLAQRYRELFAPDSVQADTIHSAFHIPLGEAQTNDINFALSKYDLIVLDEASLVSRIIFDQVAMTINCLSCRPVVVIAGDERQQQPLQTTHGRIQSTVSILSDGSLTGGNSTKHCLHHQYRVIDDDYNRFLDLIRTMTPTQEQLNSFQRDIVLFPDGDLSDADIFQAFTRANQNDVMTVSRAAADRVNRVVTERLFTGHTPLSAVPLAGFTEGRPLFPFKGMKVTITENRDKKRKIVNGQQAKIVNSENCTLVLQFAEGDKAFIYPVTHTDAQNKTSTFYPCCASYGRTISKSQGQNIQHLLLWLDCPVVPRGLAYVALSRVRSKASLSLLQPMKSQQMTPVEL